MGLTEGLFHQLIGKTEDMLEILKLPLQTGDNKKIDHLFEDRESLLKRMDENLRQTSDIGKYQPLYESWQAKESELSSLVKSSLQDLEKKIADSQNARTISKQYDSYLRQMPHGAFLDKKR